MLLVLISTKMADEKKDNSWLAPAIAGAASSALSATTKGGLKKQYRYAKKQMEEANALNRANAEWQLEQNKLLQSEQRAYDSPEQQMQRYLAAGLNPHLIYGSGGSAGETFAIGMGSVPGASMGQVNPNAVPDYGAGFMAAAQTAANIPLAQAKTETEGMRQQSMAIQNQIAKTNPMLRPEVASSVAWMMDQAAQAKAYESYARLEPGSTGFNVIKRQMEAEVAALEQKLGLNTEDLKIKNKILESKQYENAVKELQVKWLKDGDVTPEHIRQGLMLLLSKMLGK